MTSNSAEYQRGYRAGCKRTEAEVEKSRREWEAATSARNAARVRVYCAALNGLMAAPQAWKSGGKSISSAEDYAKLAEWFVDDAERRGIIR